MKLEPGQLQRLAAETGFQPEPLEKVLWLLELLEALRGHPFLAERLVLKGGTALNVFVLDLPRLSVDVDLNYVGAPGRGAMLAERPGIEQAIQAVCGRLGLLIRRTPTDHAGGKWRLAYDRSQGGTGALELDLNFLMRTPLWPPERRDSPVFLGMAARRIPVVDLHEIAGGKLAALFSRSASRDLYDVSRILDHADLGPKKLRLAFVLHGAMSRRDWRTVSSAEISLDVRDARQRLLPLLRAGLAPARDQVEDWCGGLVARCRQQLAMILPFEPAEEEFLERINGHGEIRPGLLTDEEDLQERIATHPALLWKAQNVRAFVARQDGHES